MYTKSLLLWGMMDRQLMAELYNELLNCGNGKYAGCREAAYGQMCGERFELRVVYCTV